ncbi:hypothetical protein SDC9_99683 [bioreactor metagenome]|uniref:Uncharacterized protein n=1 Tax=bioreactor metagenome TaxID=1076179 RepID=A0A645AIC0_9ZZZZ
MPEKVGASGIGKGKAGEAGAPRTSPSIGMSTLLRRGSMGTGVGEDFAVGAETGVSSDSGFLACRSGKRACSSFSMVRFESTTRQSSAQAA